MDNKHTHLLEDSLRLMDEYLDAVTDEEFIAEYTKSETNQGPLVLDYILELKSTYEKLGFKDTAWLIEKHLNKS